MRLIDADKLKKEFGYTDEWYKGRTVCEHIDNATTVSFIVSPDYVTELQNHNKELIKQLENMERLTGEWIDHQGLFSECDQCHYNTVLGYNFCPYCGADMRKGE